jgi:hypothetical protein
MKKAKSNLVLAAFLMFVSGGLIWGSAALAASGEFQYVKQAPGSKAQIYKKALLWIGETFNTGKSVVDMKDPDAGVIIGNGAVKVDITAVKWLPKVLADTTFKMKIEVKDGKFRQTFYNAQIHLNSWKPVEATNPKTIKKVGAEFAKLADSLAAYETKPADNW